MLDKDVFCSSPWLHVKITRAGNFIPCRWANNAPADPRFNIQKIGIVDYFNSPPMVELRQQLLNGEKPDICQSCYYEDSFNKLSGRKKQLFRSKLDNRETFDEQVEHSPHINMFKYSQEHNGEANVLPFDFQIDLENTCNAACIMCGPNSSSRLAVDFVKLHQVSPNVFPVFPTKKMWSVDSMMLEKFIEELTVLPNIEYIHLLGGETLYVESFYSICEALINAGLSKKIIMGTTTNCSVFSPRLENIISEFKAFHLGLSIESVNPLNDYVRYPTMIDDVLSKISHFKLLRDQVPSLHLTLRITPNIFTIFYLDEVIQYMVDNNITAESCNILLDPSCLRVELLPQDLRERTLQKLQLVAENNSLVRSATQNPDTRNNNIMREIQANVVYGYIDFLTEMKLPGDAQSERYKLVEFLKGFESIRGNSILDYAPEYLEFLKSYGY